MADMMITMDLKSYEDMCDRIDELESQADWMEGIIARGQAENEELEAKLSAAIRALAELKEKSDA